MFGKAALLYQDDHIKKPFDLLLVQAKELPEITLHSISDARRTDLLLYDDAQPMKPSLILLEKEDVML